MGYRIKRTAATTPPPELLAFDPDRWALPGSELDPRRATKAHAAWCAARATWGSTRHWPRGEDQREIEEAIAMPDEQFDSAILCRNQPPISVVVRPPLYATNTSGRARFTDPQRPNH
jgi:hypothetical protein